MTYNKKKLIEVAIPLKLINSASAREKSIRHAHPSTLHIWWARRPLAAARAVIFAQMVDDPSEYVDELLANQEERLCAEKEYQKQKKAWIERKAVFDKARSAGMYGASNPDPGDEPRLENIAADRERQRLFRLIEELVKWENTTNETVLQQARNEIKRSWRRTCAANSDHPRAKELFDPEKLPAFHDPFAGGGSLPLEAQRLGLESYASDLNPVAVLINKAMIEIPPNFAGKPPVNPQARKEMALFKKDWNGSQGLAEDVRYYGKWMRDEAEKRVGHLYPKVEITAGIARERPDLRQYIGQKLTVIAWIWTRTVKSPNPAFTHLDVPLASTFMLSIKEGKEVYVDPIINDGDFHFEVRIGEPKAPQSAATGTKLGRGSFQCLFSKTPISNVYIDDEANAGRLGARLMAIVAESPHGRVYLTASSEHEAVARSVKPSWKPDSPTWGTGGSNGIGRRYGFRTFGDYFTARQLLALTTFSELVQEAHQQVFIDAKLAGLSDENYSLDNNITKAASYADAVGVYLGFGVDKMADRHSSLCRWDPTPTASGIINTFGRQALPMAWDYAEGNPFSDASGNFDGGIGWIAKVIDGCLPATQRCVVSMADASTQNISFGKIISTDPPYYDNIGYADLSDYFYTWLRHSLKFIYPDIFATLVTPKVEELVAFTYRHESKEKAEAFFLEGMTRAMGRLAEQSHLAFPVTIYYAFKQAESDDDEGTASTGWDTFLDAVIRAGFVITGTWPIRTELANRMRGMVSNALASSIVLVCRKRIPDSPITTRREFVNVLKSELSVALGHLQAGNIAPVDLAQAAIGPGMAVYTRYTKVLDAQGQPLSVRQALALINQT